MLNAHAHHQRGHIPPSSSHSLRRVSSHPPLPLDVILCVLSFMRLIDLCRLLGGGGGDVADCCSYAVQCRAKAERWELAVYTPAGYAAALCQGDPVGRLAMARLACTSFDPKTGVLRFETTSTDGSVLLHDHLPSSVKLVCTQWPWRPAEDCTAIDLPLSPASWTSSSSPAAAHQAYNSSSDAQLSYRVLAAGSHRSVCHACNRPHGHGTKMRRVRFERASVAFRWLQQGLLQSS